MPLKGHTPTINLGAPAFWIPGVSAAATALAVTVPAYVPTPGVANPQTEQPFNNLSPATVGIQLQTVITGIVLSCSVAASTVILLSVSDASTVVFELDVSLTAGTPLNVPLPGPIIIAEGDAATVNLGAGASTCITKMNVGYKYL